MFGVKYSWFGIFLFTLTHAYCPKPTLPEIDPRPTCSWKIRKDKHGCEEYKEVCNPTVPSSKICLMDKKPGRCRGHIVRYYYDEKSGKCEQFIYGGCDGNHNNFETLKQCREACGLVSHIRMISAYTNLTEVERKKREMIYWTPKNKVYFK
uniref:BPTI/Kunitz inhibitor domain-containing protein n=1 Tax=Acrobeloides nanus TaxID=290746 RepID=A0A914BUD1_9BILA